METIRTPESRFENLKGYNFEPHYTEVDAGDGTALRMHYVDEGEGEVILCLHGQPSWSYLYRKMIPLLTKAGYRVIAPDLVGFGKSDKPIDRADYTYANHVLWMKGFVEALDLSGVTLVCQDWGSLIGLRVVAENQERFARVVLANGGLPDGTGIPVEMADKLHELLRDTPVLPAEEMFEKIAGPMEDRPQFMYWVRHSDAHPDFHPGVHMKLVLGQCDDEEYRAWSAPFPSEEYMAGARQFPSLVPIIPDNAAIPANKAAWKVFEKFEKSFITAFGDSDPVTKGGDKVFQDRVPGTKGLPHTEIKGGGHFVQERAPEQVAAVISQLIAST